MPDVDPHAQRQAQLWDLWAESYDHWHATNAPDAAVEFLISQVPSGRILELGVGTGRVALSIALRGHAVEGLDISAAMLEKLKDKIGNLPVGVHLGDMATIPVGGYFDLIYCTSSSFFHLADQDRQIDCFQAVSSRLTDTGKFVLEAFIPSTDLLDPARDITLRDFTSNELRFSATIVDRQAQRIRFQEVTMRPTGIDFLPAEERYCWPSELDLMARIAGLQLEQRYASYSKAPLTNNSAQHISVYKKSSRA
ncbi:class I SAM-dependent DNA methyltransferase [Mycobacteroides chelonae]|nr:methyltransferase [Mycobacterium sp. QIA-37]